MPSVKRKYRTIYIVTAALMVALIGGYVLAATSLSTGPQQTSNVTTSPTSGFSTASITSEQLIVMTGTMLGLGTAGTQTGAVGLAGTPSTLGACTAAPCTVSDLRPAAIPAGVTPTAGDYGEQIVLSVSQPVTGGATAPSAFDFSITVVFEPNGVLPATTYSYQGYLGTGSTTTAGGETIPVYLFLDLGTTTPVTISNNGISAVFNTCSSISSCP